MATASAAAGAGAPRLAPGDPVLFRGLGSSGARLNGRAGVVAGEGAQAEAAARGRVAVRVPDEGDTIVCVKPENLERQTYTYAWLDREEHSGVEVRQTAEYGRALFATKSFKRGELIFSEPPFIVMENGTSTKVYDTYCRAEPAVRAACADLYCPWPEVSEAASDPEVRRAIQQAEWYRRHSSSSVSVPPAAELARFFLAASANAHTYGSNGTARALYQISSKVAHSCAANSIFRKVGDRLTHRALEDISTGEMVTESYLGRDWYSTWMRRAELQPSKRFTCRCPRCTGPDWSRPLPCPECCKPLRDPRTGRGPLSREAALGAVPLPCAVLHAAAEEAGEARPWRCEACGRQFTYEDVCAAMGVALDFEAEKERMARYWVNMDNQVPPLPEMFPVTLYFLSALGPRHWASIGCWEVIGDLAKQEGRFDFAMHAKSYMVHCLLSSARIKPGVVASAMSDEVMALAGAIAASSSNPAERAWARQAAAWALDGIQMCYPPDDPRRVKAEQTARDLRAVGDDAAAREFVEVWKKISVTLEELEPDLDPLNKAWHARLGNNRSMGEFLFSHIWAIRVRDR